VPYSSPYRVFKSSSQLFAASTVSFKEVPHTEAALRTCLVTQEVTIHLDMCSELLLSLWSLFTIIELLVTVPSLQVTSHTLNLEDRLGSQYLKSFQVGMPTNNYWFQPS